MARNSVAHPAPGTIDQQNHARCTCGVAIKLIKFNWVHIDDEAMTCKERGSDGAVQQDS